MTQAAPAPHRAFLVVSTLEGTTEEPVVGPGRVMAKLAVVLRQQYGYDVSLISAFGPQDSPLTRELEIAGVSLEHLGMKSLWDMRGVTRFRQLLRSRRPAIVHSRTMRADLLARMGRSYGAKVVNNVVSLFPQDAFKWHGELKGRAVLKIARATSRRVDAWVPNAEGLTESIVKVFGAPSEAIEVIRDGISLDTWISPKPVDRKTFGIPDDAILCVTAARLHVQKGVDVLVKAAAEAVAGRSDLYFLIAGEGPDRASLEREIGTHGLDGRVILAGFREDVPGLMSASDLCVLPSRMEGLPTTVMEAMAAGIPVIATDVGGTRELVRDGVTGWLVPPDDPRALAEAIGRASSSDLRVMGSTAREHARANFTIHSMAEAFDALYSRLASND